MSAPPDSLRARLEDRADLLEATRLRYRALLPMLRAFSWRHRLRANLELLREVALAQPEVDATLDSVQRRAAAENWPPHSPPLLLVSEVRLLREDVARAALRRLASPPAAPPPLGQALLALEEQVLDTGPLFGRRTWARAVEMLPRNLPELRSACATAETFERIFKRPAPPDALPFDTQEALALQQALPVAQASLQALWQRLRRFDPSGRVHAFLERRSRRAPLQPPRGGPELLLHAAFWHGVALARLEALVDARLEPVQARGEELPPLLPWLVARESSPEARLEASAAVPESRAGLLEMAAEVAQLSRERPAGAWNEEMAWARLEAAARRAQGETGPDAERLREALRLFVRLRGGQRTPARLFSPQNARIPSGHLDEGVEDLPSLVRLARAATRL